MQGPNYLDLARLIADERHNINPHTPGPQPSTRRAHRTRQWVGHYLSRMGERLTPQPTELQLKVSTGPPCP